MNKRHSVHLKRGDHITIFAWDGTKSDYPGTPVTQIEYTEEGFAHVGVAIHVNADV